MAEQKALVGNAADEDQVKRADKKMKREHQRNLDDLREILSRPSGRRFVWRMLADCGLFKSSFHPSGSQVYFNEGTRNVGLQLWAEINEASPGVYTVMSKEAEETENV